MNTMGLGVGVVGGRRPGAPITVSRIGCSTCIAAGFQASIEGRGIWVSYFFIAFAAMAHHSCMF